MKDAPIGNGRTVEPTATEALIPAAFRRQRIAPSRGVWPRVGVAPRHRGGGNDDAASLPSFPATPRSAARATRPQLPTRLAADAVRALGRGQTAGAWPLRNRGRENAPC